MDKAENYPLRYDRRLYLAPLAGLLLFGFSLPLSKSVSSILMGLTYAFSLGLVTADAAFRTRVLRSLKQPLLLPIVLYTGVLFVGLLLTPDMKEGIGIIRQASNLLLVYMMFAVLLDVSEQSGVGKNLHSEFVVFSLLAGIFVLDIIGLLTYYGVVADRQFVLPVRPLKMHHIWFGNLNALGIYGALSFLLFSRRLKCGSRTFLLSFIVLALISLLLSTSRTAWMGFICSSAFAAAVTIRNKKVLTLLLVALIAAFMMLYQFNDIVGERIDKIYEDISLFIAGESDTSIGARFTMWKASINLFLSNPVFGIGTGGYKSAILDLVTSGVMPEWILQYNQPHNMFLFVLATNGIAGLLTLVFLFFMVFRHSLKIRSSGSAIYGFLGVSTAVHFITAGQTESLLNIHVLISAFALIAGVSVRHSFSKQSTGPPQKPS
jgi:O-antigen ligase